MGPLRARALTFTKAEVSAVQIDCSSAIHKDIIWPLEGMKFRHMLQ